MMLALTSSAGVRIVYLQQRRWTPAWRILVVGGTGVWKFDGDLQ
jgi:hypothetical protein